MKRAAVALLTLSLRVALALGLVAVPLAAAAQPTQRPIVGVLSPASSSTAKANIDALRHGLEDVGLAAGRAVSLEFRFADGVPGRLPGLAAE